MAFRLGMEDNWYLDTLKVKAVSALVCAMMSLMHLRESVYVLRIA